MLTKRSFGDIASYQKLRAVARGASKAPTEGEASDPVAWHASAASDCHATARVSSDVLRNEVKQNVGYAMLSDRSEIFLYPCIW